MTIGFDYWQVISHYPKETGMLADALFLTGHDVHVISAIGKSRIGTIAADVKSVWGDFRDSKIHEVVFDSPRQSPELKLAKCKELGITVFFDDREDVCKLLNANGIMAMQVHRKDGSKYDLKAERHDEVSNMAAINPAANTNPANPPRYTTTTGFQSGTADSPEATPQASTDLHQQMFDLIDGYRTVSIGGKPVDEGGVWLEDNDLEIIANKLTTIATAHLNDAVLAGRIEKLDNLGFDKRLDDPILYCKTHPAISRAERIAELHRKGQA